MKKLIRIRKRRGLWCACWQHGKNRIVRWGQTPEEAMAFLIGCHTTGIGKIVAVSVFEGWCHSQGLTPVRKAIVEAKVLANHPDTVAKTIVAIYREWRREQTACTPLGREE